jgi:hypothetical protein
MLIDIAIIKIKMTFSEWITDKYVKWRGNATGHDRTISDFAEWIGVSQPLMSSWMKQNGKIPRSQPTINKLVNRLGFEVYDILGLPRSVENDSISQLPPALYSRLSKAAEEIANELARRGLNTDSPEAEQIVITIFEKHGFKYTTTEETEEVGSED